MTSTDPPDPALGRAGSGAALALATFAFASCFYAWALLGPLGPDLQEAADLSDFQLSVVVAIPVLLGSLLRVPFGALSDRYGGRAILIAMLFYVPVPLIALAIWHDSFAALAVFGLLLGIAGASFAIGVPFVGKWFTAQRQGYALGIYGAGMGGTVLAGLTAPRIVDHWNLSGPFLVAAGLVVIAGIVFTLFARDAVPPLRGQAPPLATSFAPFRTERRAWALTLFYFLTFGGFVAMFLYLPKLLTGVHDLSKADAGARAAGFALLAVIGRPTGGVISDRIGATTVLKVSFAGTVVLAAILAATYTSMLPLTICCLSLAVLLGLGMGAVFKLVAEWFPQQVGGVTGVVSAAGGLGGFFPPLLMSAVKGATGSYALGFALLAFLGAICLVVLARLGRRAASRTGPSAATT